MLIQGKTTFCSDQTCLVDTKPVVNTTAVTTLPQGGPIEPDAQSLPRGLFGFIWRSVDKMPVTAENPTSAKRMKWVTAIALSMIFLSPLIIGVVDVLAATILDVPGFVLYLIHGAGLIMVVLGCAIFAGLVHVQMDPDYLHKCEMSYLRQCEMDQELRSMKGGQSE